MTATFKISKSDYEKISTDFFSNILGIKSELNANSLGNFVNRKWQKPITTNFFSAKRYNMQIKIFIIYVLILFANQVLGQNNSSAVQTELRKVYTLVEEQLNNTFFLKNKAACSMGAFLLKLQTNNSGVIENIESTGEVFQSLDSLLKKEILSLKWNTSNNATHTYFIPVIYNFFDCRSLSEYKIATEKLLAGFTSMFLFTETSNSIKSIDNRPAGIILEPLYFRKKFRY